MLMVVSEDDATLVGVLLIYATAVAIGGGAGRRPRVGEAVERIAEAAERMAGGDLRLGRDAVGGGPSSSISRATFDEMAGRARRGPARENAQSRPSAAT